MPSDSILLTSGPALKRSRVANPLSNVILVIVTSLAVFFGLFILLFVAV